MGCRAPRTLVPAGCAAEAGGGRGRETANRVPLVPSSNESVVRAALQSLGELRAQEAVAPLVDLLESGKLTLDAAQALTMITGQYFGADVGKWRHWMGTSAAEMPGRLPPEQCIRQTAERLGVVASGSGKAYRFKLSLRGGRTQTVAVYFGRRSPDGEELVTIYSECGPANAKFYEAVLRNNMAIPSGAFAIRDVDGKPQFVMVSNLLAESVTPNVLAKCIENIAARADMVEKSLTKQDKR